MKKCPTSLLMSEVQIKTTVQYHCPPYRMAVIKKTSDKCWWECGEKWEPSYMVVGMLIDTATMETNMKFPENRTTIGSMNPTSEYILKGNKNRISKSYLPSPVICSKFHNSWDTETTCVSNNGWRDKEVAAYGKMEFSNGKEGNLTMWDNIDGPWGHYAKCNKVREREVLYDIMDILHGILKSWTYTGV